MTGKRCKAITKSGEPCSSWALASGYCFTHDPSRAAERARARKAGGYNRKTPHGGGDPSSLPAKITTLQDVLALLDYTFREALELENGVARGRLLVAIAAAFTDTIKTGELEARMAALEGILKTREGK